MMNSLIYSILFTNIQSQKFSLFIIIVALSPDIFALALDHTDCQLAPTFHIELGRFQ